VIARQTFRKLAADLDYPRIMVGSRTLDRDAWDDAIDSATMQERSDLLAALEPQLLAATPQGIERSRKWKSASSLSIPSGEDLRQRALLYGDVEALPFIIEALQKCPPAVREAILDEAAFLAVGLSSNAWTASARRCDSDGRSRHREIVFSRAICTELVLHEMAHVWHAPLHGAPDNEGPKRQAIRSIGREKLRSLGPEWELAMDQQEWRSERNADALAEIWMNRN